MAEFVEPNQIVTVARPSYAIHGRNDGDFERRQMTLNTYIMRKTKSKVVRTESVCENAESETKCTLYRAGQGEEDNLSIISCQ